jgi:hypothetical protein
VSHLRIIPPIITVYPNDRQPFIVASKPPPAMWYGVGSSGDIKSDFSLETDAAQSQVSGNGAHELYSGIGSFEFTIDDQCRPTSTGRFNINALIFDVNGFQYFYGLNIDTSSIEVRDETLTQIYSESYTTVSGDVYKIELSSGFRLYRNGVLKHSRTGLATPVTYPQRYNCTLIEPTATAPTRIPQPKLIGDWHLSKLATFAWTIAHGSLTVANNSISTEYFAGTVPGNHTLGLSIEAAADAGAVQTTIATVTIPTLQVLGSADVTLQPSQKARFRTNYDAAQNKLIEWSVLGGRGSFTQDEYTAPSVAGDNVVRATAAVNGQVGDINVNVPVVITNPSGYTAAKVSEQLDFAANMPVAPYFVSAGAIAQGTGNIIPGLPPGYKANDIFLLFVESANEAVSTPSGYAIVADSPQGTGTAGGTTATRISVFWKRATSTETAPTVTDPGDHAVAKILAFRNCVGSGDPWDVTAGDTGSSSTSVSIPGDTTTLANCLIVQAVANQTDTTTPQASGYTNGDLTNLTERTDINTDQGNGGGLAVITGDKATAGAFGATTATLATASVQGRITIALKPDTTSETWTATIGSINSSSGLWTAPSLAGQTAKVAVVRGALRALIEFPILQVFPITRLATPVEGERRKKILIGESEDGSNETSRVKSESRDYYSVRITLLTLAEFNSIIAFYDEHHPSKPFIWEDVPRGIRGVFRFDSDLAWRETGSNRFDVAFRVKEVTT